MDESIPENQHEAGDTSAVNPEQAAGEAAIGEDTNPNAPIVDGANYVEDEGTARAMAEVGDEDRTHAANKRLAAEAIETYTEGYKQLPTDDGSWKQSRNRRKAEWKLNNENRERTEFLVSRGLGRRGRDADRDIMNLPYLGKRLETEETQTYLEDTKQGLRRDVERADQRAERLEEWAGVLHKHRVTQEYKDAHPRVTFSPSYLIEEEDRMNNELATADKLEEKCESLKKNGFLGSGDVRPPFGSVERPVNLDVHSLLFNLEDERDEAIEKWQELSQNTGTSLGELGIFYADLIDKAIVIPYRKRAQATQEMFDELRDGRTGSTEPDHDHNVAA